MPKLSLPPASMEISKPHARRFLLDYHFLSPPRNLAGKEGILEYIQRVGCIQYDPINVVGRNPDLVLQSRIRKYKPNLLYELLYQDRLLLDGWDKAASIYHIQDWPYFKRLREYMEERHRLQSDATIEYAPAVLKEIKKRGPLSSIDFTNEEKIIYSWGQETRLVRSTMEMLYTIGKLQIHHKVNTRRVFGLTEELIPEAIRSVPDPNRNFQEYQDWHIHRRVGGLGLANPFATECWYALLDTKTEARKSGFHRLVNRGLLIPIAIENMENKTFFIRSEDQEIFERTRNIKQRRAQAAIIGALDNLIWDRDMLRWVFNFNYFWEIYKPAKDRVYGYYVLPVLYRDRFIARFDPSFDKKKRHLTINNWWWEEGVKLTESMRQALIRCFKAFLYYLEANSFALGEKVKNEKTLNWLEELK